ncbi:hypothetical protein IWX90DRAFT_258016 [Phyllosticta citrichinensis]|uniref:Uncharacterized protein n=1 Tax=Phyllosticta citrichinensis TaxID=1130410 RepID=A0ABR1XSD4_9PEZI
MPLYLRPALGRGEHLLLFVQCDGLCVVAMVAVRACVPQASHPFKRPSACLLRISTAMPPSLHDVSAGHHIPGPYHHDWTRLAHMGYLKSPARRLLCANRPPPHPQTQQRYAIEELPVVCTLRDASRRVFLTCDTPRSALPCSHCTVVVTHDA